MIFIDDLDRCQPQNVVATLEMVDFLVSSGDCIVVLGMARERVERCVGLGFKDLAEVLGAEDAGVPVARISARCGGRGWGNPATGPARDDGRIE